MSSGCTGYPPLVNDAAVNDWMRQTRDLAGAEAIVDESFGMGAEDFAYMTQAARRHVQPGGQDRRGRRPPCPRLRHRRSGHAHRRAVLAETARRFVTGASIKRQGAYLGYRPLSCQRNGVSSKKLRF